MEPNELFTRVFLTLSRRWADTYGFRQIVNLGLPHLTAATALDNRQAAEWFVHDPAHDAFFIDKNKFLAEQGGIDAMAAAATARTLGKFRKSVDAASLVFMHSALDGAAFDLCRVTALVAPLDWEPFVSDKKVSLAEVKSEGYNNLFSGKLADHLKALDRESLLKKIDRLFQICRLPAGFVPIVGYQFDREAVDKLDIIRHGIIHGDPGGTLPADVDGSINFLRDTGMHLVKLVNHRYGVKIDPQYAE